MPCAAPDHLSGAVQPESEAWTFTGLRFIFARVKTWKIVVERHPDVYVAFPLGLKGVVVGEGHSDDAALADYQSAIHFHLESFGAEAAFIAEADA